MGAGAVAPGVVGGLVVVLHGDHRQAAVKLSKVGIGAVAGVALAVFGEVHDLAGRGEVAQGGHAGLCIGPGERGFVDVVAGVDGKVDVVARGGMGVGVEPARCSVGAGEHRDAERCGVAIGQCACAASVGDLTIWCDEAIVQPAAGGQVVDDGADAVVVGGRDFDFARGDRAGEGRVLGDFNAEAREAGGDVACPQDDARLVRITGGDAVREASEALREGAARKDERCEAGGAGRQQVPACDDVSHDRLRTANLWQVDDGLASAQPGGRRKSFLPRWTPLWRRIL